MNTQVKRNQEEKIENLSTFLVKLMYKKLGIQKPH